MPGPLQELTDRELLARSAGGDEAAFAAFVDRHGASVLRFLRWLGADAEAEDLLQETLTAAWRHAASFRGDGPARSWLFTTARRLRLRELRRSGSEPAPDELAELAEAAGWGASSPGDDVAARLTDSLALEQAMRRLSEPDRAILLLVDAEGLALSEAAGVLALGLAATKSRLHRARLRLAAELRGGGSR